MRLLVPALAGMLASLAAAAQEAAQPGQPPAGTPAAAAPIAPGPAPQRSASPSATKPADIAKAVDCATLVQQFGDTLTALTAPTAAKKLDEGVKNSATDQAAAGRKSCMAHDYDAGLAQLRQAIGQLGKRPIL